MDSGMDRMEERGVIITELVNDVVVRDVKLYERVKKSKYLNPPYIYLVEKPIFDLTEDHMVKMCNDYGRLQDALCSVPLDPRPSPFSQFNREDFFCQVKENQRKVDEKEFHKALNGLENDMLRQFQVRKNTSTSLESEGTVSLDNQQYDGDDDDDSHDECSEKSVVSPREKESQHDKSEEPLKESRASSEKNDLVCNREESSIVKKPFRIPLRPKIKNSEVEDDCDRIFQCDLCEQRFFTGMEKNVHCLNAHMRSFTDTNTSACTLCKLIFRPPRNLIKHVLKQHMKTSMKTMNRDLPKRVQCVNCEKMFSKCSLRRHELNCKKEASSEGQDHLVDHLSSGVKLKKKFLKNGCES